MASARAEAAAEQPAKGGGRENRHQQRRHIEDRDIGLAGITDTAGDCRAPDAMHHGDQRQRHRGDDAEKDFAPISMVGTQPNILVVNPQVPVHSVAELIALARKEPGKLNYGNSGYGAAAHLSAELFKAEAHVEIVGINYKGASPALQVLIAGHTQLMFATSASVISHIKSGLVRPIAVTTLKRFSLMPDLPTVAESGLPGFDATTWHGLVAPAGTPKDVIETLHRAMAEGLKDPET